MVAALIEARGWERFQRTLEVLDDPEVEALLLELGPVEERRWKLFFNLAVREIPEDRFMTRWQAWQEFEQMLTAWYGRESTVHG